MTNVSIHIFVVVNNQSIIAFHSIQWSISNWLRWKIVKHNCAYLLLANRSHAIYWFAMCIVVNRTTNYMQHMIDINLTWQMAMFWYVRFVRNILFGLWIVVLVYFFVFLSCRTCLMWLTLTARNTHSNVCAS